jgi:hypothetical protein
MQIAAMVGGFGGGGAAAAAGAGAGGAGTSAAAEAPPAQQQQVVQINIQGPVYGSQRFIDELVDALSEAVDQRGKTLIAKRLVNGQPLS